MRIILTGVLCLLCTWASTQDKIQSLDDYFEIVKKDEIFNGNVLIAEKGQIIYKKSFGFSDYATSTPLTENSVFDLAGLTNQFTAMAVMILKEQKKLKYDDPITQYIPQLSFYNGVTIRHLLNHTSGIPDFMETMDKHWDKSMIATNSDVIEILATYMPYSYSKPGERFEFSNTGYLLLATIIESISKMPYEEYMQSQIFDKLGMANTTVLQRRMNPKIIQDYAWGYVYDDVVGSYLIPDSIPDFDIVYWQDGLLGHQGISSTVNDLFIWDRALKENSLVSFSTFKESLTPIKLGNGLTSDYSFGWGLHRHAQYGAITYHSGGWPGYKTYIERHLETDKTIIFLFNCEESKLPIRQVREMLHDEAPVVSPMVKADETKEKKQKKKTASQPTVASRTKDEPLAPIEPQKTPVELAVVSKQEDEKPKVATEAAKETNDFPSLAIEKASEKIKPSISQMVPTEFPACEDIVEPPIHSKPAKTEQPLAEANTKSSKKKAVKPNKMASQTTLETVTQKEKVKKDSVTTKEPLQPVAVQKTKANKKKSKKEKEKQEEVKTVAKEEAIVKVETKESNSTATVASLGNKKVKTPKVEKQKHPNNYPKPSASIEDKESFVAKPVKEVTPAKSVISQYEGEYQIRAGFSITIATIKGKLYGQATGQDKFELFETKPDHYQLKVVNATIEFVKVGDKYKKLIIKQDGKMLEGVKL